MKKTILLLILALITGWASGGVVASFRPPNIIYINTDDWGIGKVPCYKMDPKGAEIIKTPHLDQLAADGMLFSNAYAGNAICSPSRCVFLTGRHSGHAVWRANHATPTMKPWLPEEPMLGKVAKQAGYVTAAFGKISAGGTDTPENITGYGWDYWLGFLGHIDCRDYYSQHIWENGKQIPLPKNNDKTLEGSNLAKGGNGLVKDGTFIEDLYADRIIEFMSENKEKPFFIYFASTVPHGGNPGGMRVPDYEGYDKLDLTLRERIYCALLTRHDKNVGRIRQAVEELGLAENTIIMWTSDNGDQNSYYRRTRTFDGNGPFRKQKGSLYEGGIRVPLIAWWPGTVPAGTTCDLPTAQLDLMPTVAEAGGNKPAGYMDGISIFPTLRGEPDKQRLREYLYWEYIGKQQAVRMGKWKAYREGGLSGTVELYDLEKDIGESTDLSAEYPEVVARVAEIMAKEHTPHPYWIFEGEPGYKPPKKSKKKQ